MIARYTASVVGAGTGGRLSIAALAASERFELTAVADLSEEARASVTKEHPNVRTFASHQEMFAACPTDVVCVSTYPPSHEMIASDALALPLKGILVEKPLAHTASAGKRLLERVKERHLPIAVPHGLLVLPHSRQILDRVWGGEIGELKLVEIQSSRWDILSAGIHWLNFFVVLTQNEPIDYVMAACDGSSRTYRDGMQVETLAVAYAQTKSGIRVVMNTGDEVKISRTGRDTLFRLVGTAGIIEFWGWAGEYSLFNSQYPQGKHVHVPPSRHSAHQLHLEALAEQIDRHETDYRVAESSLTALQLCEGAYLSNRYRCLVAMPLENFEPPPANDWNPGEPYTGIGGGRDGRKR